MRVVSSGANEAPASARGTDGPGRISASMQSDGQMQKERLATTVAGAVCMHYLRSSAKRSERVIPLRATFIPHAKCCWSYRLERQAQAAADTRTRGRQVEVSTDKPADAGSTKSDGKLREFSRSTPGIRRACGGCGEW